MKTIARCTILIFIVGCFGGRALGDGKFYVDKVPPGIPYQRAFILLHEGSETLVLQSKYELSQSEVVDSIGWVIPVPLVPEIASANVDVTRMFFFFASRSSQPEVIRISIIFASISVLFFFGGFVFLLVCVVKYPSLDKIGLSKTAWSRQARNGVTVTLIAFILTIMIGIQPLGRSGGIEVIKTERAGIYDVKIVKSESAEAILGWLSENGFGFTDNDTHVFTDYINRGWCFVVAKVGSDQETRQQKLISDGMVDPLILKFETDTAVYPLTLTSTVGAETEILLYTFSENKLSCGERLTLRYASEKKSTDFMVDLLSRAEPESIDLSADIPKEMYLCKFRKKLKPQEMKTDLQFEFAQDNESYREKKIVW